MPERERARQPETAAPPVAPPSASLERCQICGAPHEAGESILCRVCGEPVLRWGWA